LLRSVIPSEARDLLLWHFVMAIPFAIQLGAEPT
jgi:hypothetical protein